MKNIFAFLLFTLSLSSQNEKISFSLFFENNQFSPTKAHLEKIDSIKAIYKPEKVSLVLNGYTNEIGTNKYNLKLSKKRVNFIEEKFNNYKIISSTGKGEIKGISAKNRRVDIIISIEKGSNMPTINEEEVKETIYIIEPEKVKINDLSKIKIGEKVVLNEVYFFPGKDLFRNISYESLNELLNYLKQNSSVRIKILGHICCSFNKNPLIDGLNTRTGKRNLSEARAKSVYNYLVNKGIDKNRLDYVGLAYKFPTGKGDYYDRRVEIEILK